MKLKDDALIGYNLLEKKIINTGLCTTCGACEAACPIETLKIEKNKVIRQYDCTECLDLCPICYSVCPHSKPLLLRSLEAVSDAPIKNGAIGYYRKILLAQTVDSKLREKGGGARVVTALLNYGIENNFFDSAIVSVAEPEDGTRTKPIVACIPDDIFSAEGSKFFPIPVVSAYGSAVNEYLKKKIAVVGVPCHVLALRKMEAWQHKITENLKLVIGLLCFGTYSLKPLQDYLAKNYNIQPSEIIKMHLSKELIVETKNKTIKIPFEEAEDKILLSCRTCADFTAEFADISIGRAFPLKDWSVVIIRTKKGEDFFSAAVEKGVIKVREIENEPKVFERVMEPAIKKRTKALQMASKFKKTYGFIPARLLKEAKMLTNIKVEDIMTRDVKTVPYNMTVNQFLERMAVEKHIGYPVTNEKGELSGIVTIEEAWLVDKKKRDEILVGAIARPNLDVVYPGETASDAFKKMSQQETGRVLVLDPKNPQRLIGIITKTDLLHALTKQS
jgi:coenzyme F420 hydrogenase subunit beta